MVMPTGRDLDRGAQEPAVERGPSQTAGDARDAERAVSWHGSEGTRAAA